MTVSTGIRRPTRRAVRANSRGLPNDSTYRIASRVMLVLLPPHQHVVAGHVVLVADRGERRHPDAQPAKVLEQRDPHAAGLHDQAREPGAAGRPRRSRSGPARAR